MAAFRIRNPGPRIGAGTGTSSATGTGAGTTAGTDSATAGDEHFLGHFALSHQRFRAQARQRSAGRQKPRRVLARWNVDADGMVRPVGLVVFAQPLAQTMRLYADDGIALLVEIGRTPQSLHRDVVFLDLFGGAFEVFGAHVGQHLRQVRGAVEYAGCQNAVQLMSFLPKVGCRLHGKRPRLVEGSIHVRGSDVQVR